MRFTLPMSTPAKRTGAPSRKPPALSKYDRSVIFLVNHPPVPLIRKIRTMRVALATTTVSPTRSCDHLSCFWLGKVVCKRQKHHSKHRNISLILNRRTPPQHMCGHHDEPRRNSRPRAVQPNAARELWRASASPLKPL